MSSPELRSYQPSMREMLAQRLLGDGKPSPLARRAVGSIMGTQGMPGTEQMGVADLFPPTSAIFGADEAKRAQTPGGMAEAAFSVIPGGKGVIPVVKAAEKAIEPVVKKSLGFLIAHRNAADKVGKYDYLAKGDEKFDHEVGMTVSSPFKDQKSALAAIKQLEAEGITDYKIFPAELMNDYLHQKPRGRLDEFITNPKPPTPDYTPPTLSRKPTQ